MDTVEHALYWSTGSMGFGEWTLPYSEFHSKQGAAISGTSPGAAQEWPPGTLIDYILVGGGDSAVTMLDYWIDQHSIWRNTSDHFGVVADLQIKGGLSDKHRLRKGKPMGESPLRRTLMGEEAYNLYGHKCYLNSLTDAWLTVLALPAADHRRVIQQLSLDAVDATNDELKHCGNQRSRHKGRWSPYAVGLQIHLFMLQAVKRQLQGQSNHRRWITRMEVTTGIYALATEWENLMHSLRVSREHKFTRAQALQLMEVTGKPPHWWRTAEYTIHSIGHIVDSELGKMKKLLQGRKRAEERAKFNSFTLKMHDQLELGEPKLAITSMMQSWRQISEMDELTLSDGTTTADATAIMIGVV